MVNEEIQLSGVIASFSAMSYLLFRYFKTINFSGNINVLGYSIQFSKIDNSQTTNQENNPNENNHEQEIEIQINSV